MDGEEVKHIQKRHHEAIESVQDRTLDNVNLSETEETRQVIQQAWEMKDNFSQTGALKILSLLDPISSLCGTKIFARVDSESRMTQGN